MLQASVSDPENVFLSISTPSLSHEATPSSSGGLPELTLQETRKTYGRFAEIVEPPREGYVLTLKLNFSGLTRQKGTYPSLRRSQATLSMGGQPIDRALNILCRSREGH